MKVVDHYPKNREILHIEVPGCVINIYPNLYGEDGKQVTTIEILADQYVDEKWSLPDFNSRANLKVRVMKES